LPARALSSIGAAVIGSGFIGTVHIEALRRIGVPIVGLLETTPELGAERATALGVAKAYGSLDELLGDERVEVVHVTSPNHLHFEHASAVLAAGRNIICEKPLAITPAQSGELVKRAKASGKVAAVNFNIRFYPINQHLHAAVAAGEVGDVRLISGHYFQDWLMFDTDWNWRLEPEHGGELRAVGDIGSHWFDLTSFVSGRRVAEVMADMATFIKVRHKPAGRVETFSLERATDTVPVEIKTEDAASILVRYDNGARGVMAVSQISAGRKNSLQYEVDGSNSAVAWDSEQPDSLWIGHRGRPNELLQRDFALLNEQGRSAEALPGGHVEGFFDTFAAAFRAVYADISTGQMREDPPYATFVDGHEEMLVGEAVALSARESRWVQMKRDASAEGQQ
jgi:predicted dehydrogenase